MLQDLNLDVAGEFQVMASTLIHIKSKMQLPPPETAQESQVRERVGLSEPALAGGRLALPVLQG